MYGFGSAKKRIRPDPDPQPYKVLGESDVLKVQDLNDFFLIN